MEWLGVLNRHNFRERRIPKMAITSKGFVGSVTVIDNGANTSTLSYDLTAATVAAAVTDMGDIVARLVAVTDAVVKSYTVGEVFSEDALSLPASGVQVENQARISGKLSGFVDKFGRVMIPAPKPGIFVGSSGKTANVVDASDADLVAYLNTWITGGEATISDGEVLDTISPANVSGKRYHRGSVVG